MTRAALLTLCVFALLAPPSFAQNPGNATDDAIAESVRREAFRLELNRKLADAQNRRSAAKTWRPRAFMKIPFS